MIQTPSPIKEAMMFEHIITRYTARQAAYDMNKLLGKSIVIPIKKQGTIARVPMGVRVLAGLLILREKVIKPILAGISKTTVGRPPKNVRPIDTTYESICNEMLYFTRLQIALLASTPLSQRSFPERSRREVYARAKYISSCRTASRCNMISTNNMLSENRREAPKSDWTNGFLGI
jgi:hypothetical protein